MRWFEIHDRPGRGTRDERGEAGTPRGTAGTMEWWCWARRGYAGGGVEVHGGAGHNAVGHRGRRLEMHWGAHQLKVCTAGPPRSIQGLAGCSSVLRGCVPDVLARGSHQTRGVKRTRRRDDGGGGGIIGGFCFGSAQIGGGVGVLLLRNERKNGVRSLAVVFWWALMADVLQRTQHPLTPHLISMLRIHTTCSTQKAPPPPPGSPCPVHTCWHIAPSKLKKKFGTGEGFQIFSGL